MSEFQLPNEFKTQTITIDGNDVSGLFVSLSVFENIYTPLVTGHITLVETDSAKFIEDYKIEGVEKFECEFKTGQDSYKFEGYLNGLRNKNNDQAKTMYTFDFTTEEVRKNEENFITKAYRDKQPKDIVQEMIEKMGGKEDKVQGEGIPMTMLPCNKRPYDVIKYVLRHGVVQDSNASEGEVDKVEEESKGNGGFMCWATSDGFRFNTIEKVMKGEAGGDAGEFKSQMMNKGQGLSEMMKSIVAYDFQIMGDFQAKLRSGAFVSKMFTFDLDKLHYKEYEYDNKDKAGQKMKQFVPENPTRLFSIAFSNERFMNECDKAQPQKYDLRKKFIQQSPGGENTSDDSQGTVTLYPACKIRAGDKITLKIGKVDNNEYDKKHSGKYICSEVAHHFSSVTSHAYTRVSVIRSTKQQDDSSSN
jgi:hypothetical protein